MQTRGGFPRLAGRGITLALLFGAALAELPPAYATTPYWATNSIAFASAEYSVTQAQGSVSVAVRRTGDSSQAASIQFWSANSSAVAGRDYSSASGTLSWSAGDSSAKTITIAVKKAPSFTGNRSFDLWLGWVSNASTGSQDERRGHHQWWGAAAPAPPAPPRAARSRSPARPATSVTAGSSYHFQPNSSAPAGASVAFSIANKPHWASFSTVNGALDGTPAASDVGTTANIGISASDGTATSALPAFSLTVKAAAAVPPSGAGSGSGGGSTSRPAYNTGDGFFVLNGTLYDPNGNAFRIRGVNRAHWDSNSAAGLALSGANTVRTFIDLTRPESSNVNLIQTQNIDNKEVPVVTYNGIQSSTSCSTDPAVLSTAVSFWTAQANSWTTLNRYLIVNVAN